VDHYSGMPNESPAPPSDDVTDPEKNDGDAIVYAVGGQVSIGVDGIWVRASITQTQPDSYLVSYVWLDDRMTHGHWVLVTDLWPVSDNLPAVESKDDIKRCKREQALASSPKLKVPKHTQSPKNRERQTT
jgi:hypothetical protein